MSGRHGSRGCLVPGRMLVMSGLLWLVAGHGCRGGGGQWGVLEHRRCWGCYFWVSGRLKEVCTRSVQSTSLLMSSMI